MGRNQSSVAGPPHGRVDGDEAFAEPLIEVGAVHTGLYLFELLNGPRIDFVGILPFKLGIASERVPNERTSDACNQLHQLRRARQPERNAHCDRDRSGDRVGGRATEACSGSIRLINARTKDRPKAVSDR